MRKTREYATMEDRGNEVRVRIDIDQASPEDVTVNVTGDGVHVTAWTEEDLEVEGAIMHREGELYRFIALPQDLDYENMRCSFENGYLELQIPKAS